jgi:hypothetical protein
MKTPKPTLSTSQQMAAILVELEKQTALLQQLVDLVDLLKAAIQSR